MKMILCTASILMLAACEAMERRSVNPEMQSTSLVSEKMRCAEVGWSFLDRVKKDDAEGHQLGGAFLEVRYAYNPKLDTCLCSYERMFTYRNPPYSHFLIWDTLSGKMLAHATTVAPETLPPFELKWKELMGIEREEDLLRGKSLE